MNVCSNCGRPVAEHVCEHPVPCCQHVIEGSRLLDLLRSVAAGKDPDLAFAALWANAAHESNQQ